MPCRHPDVALTILIIREMRIVMPSATIDYDYPIVVKVSVNCPDCKFTNNYNAYAADPHMKRAGATAWPKWLLAHIQRVACADAYYRKAFNAVHVPGVLS